MGFPSAQVVVESRLWSNSALRRAIVWLLAVKVFLLIVVFDPTRGTAHPFDLPKTSASRLVARVLVAALAISLARYGPRVFPLTRLHLIVAAYLIAVGFAAIVGADSYTAAFGDEGR